ncbi:PucR family transcriptional regulator [Ammoniphilus resinae]|uniref:Purine catabolism regulator n=1 Tax=Ammoniphilus resinae TaxID=861532 RepID=A0ABS4GU43_9BACL|nr:PucR family transcriptional regulator [Ammoniphilus resinae]MBP1933642.1 purine catabolism regulator [Ammoniphilus resinae]
MLQVMELVELESFTMCANLIAGREGLRNEIGHVTIMEVPDFHQWVNEDEFVLSNFFSIKDDLNLQIETIRALSRKGIAALAIKEKRFLQSIHPSLLEVADELQLPLFSIDKDVKFRDIIRIISEELIDRKNESYRQTIAFQDKIMALSMKGSSPERLCLEIQRYVGYDCAILSPDRRLIAGKVTNSQGKEIPSVIGEQVADLDAVLNDMAINHDLVDHSSIEFYQNSYLIAGCYVKGKLISYLVFSAVRSWGFRESLLTKYAANAVGMNQLESHLQDQLEKKMLVSFVEEIILEGMEEEVLCEKASFLGWKILDEYQVVIIKAIEEAFSPPDACQSLMNRLARRIQAFFPSALPVARKNELVILVSLPHNSAWCDQAHHEAKLKEFLSLHYSYVSLEKQVRIGIGSIFGEAKSIPISYKQANTLVQYAVNKKGVLWYATDHLLELFLLHSKEQTERKQIRQQVVDSLVRYDRENGTELFETLKAYLVSDSLESAAESLFIHPNTLRNRLAKVTEVTGMNPQRPSGRMVLFVALIENI